MKTILAIATVLFAGNALAQAGPYSYYVVAPCRVADTRLPGTNGAPALAAGETRNMQIRGLCGVPMIAKAVSYNMAVVTPTTQTHLIVWASGLPRQASPRSMSASTILPLRMEESRRFPRRRRICLCTTPSEAST